MKMLSATSVAALALGLILSGSAAYAADGQDRGAQGNQDTQHQNDQNAGDHKGKKQDKVETPPAQTAPVVRGHQANDQSQGNPNFRNAKHRRGNNDRSNDRGHNDVTPIINQTDQRTNDNNRRTNPNWNDNRRTNPNWNDNARRNNPNWNANNNNNRRNVDMSRWHRNFDAPRRFHIGVYNAPRGYSYRRWGYGQRLPRDYYARDFWLSDFLSFGLLSPPEGFIWVRYGPDALLVDEETGEIIEVEYNVFYS